MPTIVHSCLVTLSKLDVLFLCQSYFGITSLFSAISSDLLRFIIYYITTMNVDLIFKTRELLPPGAFVEIYRRLNFLNLSGMYTIVCKKLTMDNGLLQIISTFLCHFKGLSESGCVASFRILF